MGRTHLVIPDVQVKPGQDLDFLRWIGNYIVRKRPDVVVCLGDFADMESLSSYDVGKKSFEGRRYKADIEAAHRGMDILFGPLRQLDKITTQKRKCRWRPDLHLTLGNHEARITRAVENDSKLDGTLGLEDLQYDRWGWRVYPFLEPVNLDGIIYCHYLVSGIMGRPITTAQALLSKKHMSCIVGHQQGRQISIAQRADGKTLTAIIAGSCYIEPQAYLNPQTNRHWSGIILLHEVNDGEFSEIFISLDYLRRKYSHKNAWWITKKR